MNPRTSFALHLEVSGTGVIPEHARGRAGESAVREVRQRWSGRLHGPRVTRAQVEAELGPADGEEESGLLYHFPERPDYVYAFVFGDRGLLVWSGYQRAAPMPAPSAAPDSPANVAAYADLLVRIGATEAELREWLGEPAEREGWWPIESWSYANGLVLNLRHGIVE